MALESKNGFTIIELIFVLVIIAVIYITATAAFKSFGYQKVDMISKKIISDFNYARSISMTQPLDATYGVMRAGIFFQNSPLAYTVYLGTYTNAVEDPVNPANRLSITMNTGEYKGVSFAYSMPGPSPNIVEFDSRGRPCSAGGTLWNVSYGPLTLTMQYTGQTSNYRYIYIWPPHGRIELQ